MTRILLSGPDVGPDDRAALLRAFDAGWIAPAGPELIHFESELVAYTGAEACVALSSGTAALHLALLIAGVGPGDDVIVQSATFAASAFAVVHAGATPIFCDIDPDTWALDPDLLADFLTARVKSGAPPKAVMPVDLYGSCADYGALIDVCAEHGVTLIEDAAEALGSISGGRMAGTFGHSAALSFNGNKIITTSGGGALLGPADVVDQGRYLATQARMPELHYEHCDIGFNYRLSNLLAALGRSQLASLEDKIERRAEIHRRYLCHSELGSLEWCPHGVTERPNRWLNVAVLPEEVTPNEVCVALDRADIEARPAWKPMHLQPVFKDALMIGGQVSEDLYRRGLCLPSGSGLSDADVDRVADELGRILRSARGGS